MAVSIANYPPTSKAYNDEKVASLAGFLPSQQALSQLGIFETVAVVPQQNGSVTNKNIFSFNNKRNSFPRSVPQNSSISNMYSDLPSQQVNHSNSDASSSIKMRRAASLNENSVVCDSNANDNNNNNDSLTTTEKSLNRKSETPLIIHISPKVDNTETPRSLESPKLSPKEKPLPNERSLPEYSLEPFTIQLPHMEHVEQKQEILENNQNKPTSDENAQEDENQKNQNISIEDYNIQNPKSPQSQTHNRAFFRHSMTLNENAGGSSTDLRKSMYKDKEPSFKKRLRRVFSLTNVKQDDNNSASNSKFSSLRGKKYQSCNFDDNNNDDDDTSVSSASLNSDNASAITRDINNKKKPSRRRSFMDFQALFSSKNEKKQSKQDHQKLDDNKKNDSENETRENDNNDDKQQNENGNERVDDPAFIPSKLLPLRTSSIDSSSQIQYQNSTSPLCNQFRINKSKDIDNSPGSRPLSLPASAKNEETSSPTPRRSSIPAHMSNNITVSDDNDNNQAKKSFVNLGVNATRSVPSLVLLRDTDIPPTSSTPSPMKKLQFSSTILIHETWTREDYDRRGDQSTCNKLTSTPILAQRIKQELNEYKTYEMPVHEDSKDNTHFFA